MSPEDWERNNRAVAAGGRLLSSYTVQSDSGESHKVWIITEADRSATTVLLPDDY